MQKDYSNEAILVAAINRKDPGAYEYIRKTCYGSVHWRVVTNDIGSEEDAEDIFNEGLLGLLMKVKKRKLVMSSKVSTLFISICENQWRDVLKGRASHERNAMKIQSEIEATPEEKMDRAVFRDVAVKCFSQLEELCQKIFKLIDEEKEHSEIGKILGLSPAYIKKRNHLCHKEWIRLVKKHPGYLTPGDHNPGEGI